MEDKINAWRRRLHKLRLEPGQIAELEQHLRDTVDELLIKGYHEDLAFEIAAKRIGNPKTIAKQEWNVNGKRGRRSAMPSFVPVYFAQAWRHLRRAKMHTFITLSGLVAGLTACILLAIYVKFENSYDDFHDRPEHVYRIVNHRGMNGNFRPDERAYLNLAWNIRESVPGLAAVTGVNSRQSLFYFGDESSALLQYIATDPDFNEIFRFPLIDGNAMVLDRPNTIYLTESTAQRMFGDENPVGQFLRLSVTEHYLEVVGVLRDPPGNSHLDFEAVVPSLGVFEENTGDPVLWGALTGVVFARLYPDTSTEAVEKAVTSMYEGKTRLTHVASLQPLQEIHLDSEFSSYFKPKADRRTIRLFAMIAATVLLIACMNTAMIALAEYLKRVREIGMRKVLGASLLSVLNQFAVEQLLKLVIAIPIAVVLASGMLPWLSAVMDRNLGQDIVSHIDIVIASIGFVTAMVLLAGVFPAIFVYRNQSRSSLAGHFLSGRITSILRRAVITLQFSLSLFLLMYLVGVYSQIQFAQTRDLGYDPENLVLVGAYPLGMSSQAFLDQVLGFPEVVSASLTGWSPRDLGNERYDSTMQRTVYPREISADFRTLETLGLMVTDGRGFSPGMPALDIIRLGWDDKEDGSPDVTPSNPIIVTQSYVDFHELHRPVIGTYVQIPVGQIVGVVQDYQHGSLHQFSSPIAFVHATNGNRFLIRYRSGTEANVIHKLQVLHAELSGGLPMHYEFVDEIINGFYESDRRQAKLFAMAIAVALTLSLMGLFGMVAFALERRTKEIGIRKILGADIPQLVWTLTKDVYALVALGAFVAAPFAYRLLDGWLQQYAYRIEPGWELAGIALLAAVVPVALLLVWQAGRAALENPVKALRSE